MPRKKEVRPSSSSSSYGESSRQEGPSIRDQLRDALADKALYDKYELLLSDKDLWALMLVEFSPELAERTQEVSGADKISVEDKAQVEMVSKYRDERRIREAIASVLGKAPSQITDRDYEKVTRLDLSGASIKNIEFLAELTNLQSLFLSGTQVSGIGALSVLTNLQTLSLSGTQVSDIGALSVLTNLQWLDLSRTQVSDIGALSVLTNLQLLSLSGTQVSDIGALSGLTNLLEINLSGTQVSDIGAVSSLQNLQSLYLSSTQVSDISAVSGLTNLAWLNLYGTGVSDEQVAELQKALPKLDIRR